MLFYVMLSAFAEEPVYTPHFHVANRPQVWSNPDYDSSTADGIWSVKQLTRIGITAETKALTLQAKFQDYRMWGEEASPFLNKDVLQTMHEGYAQIAFTPKAWLRLGRQEYRLNDGRLLWAAPWTLFDRSYDGARFYAKGKSWEYNLFGSVSRSAQNYQTICDDSVADCSDFQPETINSHGDYFLTSNLNLNLNEALNINPYLLAVHQDSSADDLNQDRRIYTLGAYAKGKPAQNIFYSLEAAYQMGQESADVSQSAWMAAGELGYKKSGKKLAVFYEELSGDGDSTDNVQHDFDSFQASRHKFRGMADVVGTKNIRDYGVKTNVAIKEKFELIADVHHFELSNPEGFWYAVSNQAIGGGEAGNTESVLGNELDLRLDYKPSKSMNLQLTEGIFMPSGYGAEITAGDVSMTTYLWMRYTL